MQIARLVADLATLKEQRQDLAAKRDALENSYRVSAIESFGMEEETMHNNILRARSSPQKNKYLQRIHEAHGEVLSKESEMSASVHPGCAVTMSTHGHTGPVSALRLSTW